MKKCILFLLIALLANSTIAFAALPYDEMMKEITDNNKGQIDLDSVDLENIITTDYNSILNLERKTTTNKGIFWVTLRSKNSDDVYVVGFNNGKYKYTEKNGDFVDAIKEFDINIGKKYFSKAGLGEPDEVKSYLLDKRDGHIFAYEIICDGNIYIIPYRIDEYDAMFNVNNDPKCEIEIGKVYTLDEFAEINIEEDNQYLAFVRGENDNRTKKHIHYKKDGETYCTWDCDGVDHALHLGKGTDEPEIVDDEKKTDTKKDDQKEPEKDTDNQKDVDKNVDKETTEKEKTDTKEDDSTPSEPAKKPTGKTPSVVFSDVPKDHWAHDDITALAEKSVILGYGNGKFGVDDSVTHEQLSLLLKRQFDYDEENRLPSPAKREEIIVSLVKSLSADLSETDTSAVGKFSDADTISADDEKYIAYAINSGLVLGYDGKLNLSDNVTRAETAALICRAMKLAK